MLEVDVSKTLPLPMGSKSILVRSVPFRLGLPQILVQQGHVLCLLRQSGVAIYQRTGGEVKGHRACLGQGKAWEPEGLHGPSRRGGGVRGGRRSKFHSPSRFGPLGRGDSLLVVRFVRAMM
ncbi:hypothetical protein LIER_16831 [Lithospermum erythrorhizon]|uniref:Uncharacterized protein n=1 Tax=Lithospermum erythrorhizon TaxID=34254 RepID=A0AAV3QAR7_LITER